MDLTGSMGAWVHGCMETCALSDALRVCLFPATTECGLQVSQASCDLGRTHSITPVTDLFAQGTEPLVPASILGSGHRAVLRIAPCGDSSMCGADNDDVLVE